MAGVVLRPRPAVAGLTGMLRSPAPVIAAITLVAAGLRLRGIDVTKTDPYYDAAIRSMGQSWHNFFFAAFEPGGSVAIDKPPLDLWVQVASTKLFGLNPTGLLLPEALAGTLAVPLLFDLVRRVSGVLAGLVAALVLAVMPASVLTSRSDTMDSLMMALTVLAAWLVVVSIERRRARWLYVAAAVVGLAFEVKLLEALIALPALVLLYALGSDDTRRRRLMHLGVAAAVYAVAALWWLAAVSIVPGHKPYPLGSTNGSVWNATFVFNGTSRFQSPPTRRYGAHVRHRHRVHGRFAVHHRARPHRTPPGAARLFDPGRSRYGELVGGELVAAAALATLAVALALFEAGGRRRRAPDTRLRWAFCAALVAWIVPAVVVFSVIQQLHARYLEAVTPAVAAAIGVGFAALLAAARRTSLGAVAFALALMLAAADVVSTSSQGAAEAVLALLAAAAAAVAIGIAVVTRAQLALVAAALLAVASLAVAPAARSAALVRRHATDSGHPGAMAPRDVARLSAYLAPRTRGLRYEVLFATYGRAGPLIVHDGRPVLIALNFGNQPLLSIAQVRAHVAAGRVRYAVFDDTCGSSNPVQVSHCAPVLRWIRAHSVDVSSAAGLSRRGVLFRLT